MKLKRPRLKSSNGVLRTRKQFEQSIIETSRLNLPLHPDPPKNWDSLAALSLILKYINKNGKVLDAGGEIFSMILHQLKRYGYKKLFCLNIIFDRDKFERGIKYVKGDLTKTNFDKGYFDAVVSQSVIEHGVDIENYFKEMSRILKPKGILFTSTDYWCQEINTKNRRAYNNKIKIFTSEEIKKMISLAKKYGLEILSQLRLKCKNKVVRWEEFDLEYTFIYFTLVKK